MENNSINISMNKKQIALLIIVSVLAGWLFNLFAGRFLTAKLSTWPLLNRMKFLSPQAPIVINNKETVRVSDSEDVALAVAGIKSKISAVVLISQGTAQVVGSAINLTSNGDFVTGSATFTKPSVEFYVVLNDGRSGKIISMQKDPSASLVYFKALLESVPTVNFGSSANLSAGDKVVYIQKSGQSFFSKAYLGTVNSAQGDVAGTVFESNYIKRGFTADITFPLVSGEAVVNTRGEVVGIYNGSWLISSDSLKQSLSNYLNNPDKISRPAFGFNYLIISSTESKLTKTAEGMLVTDVQNPSAARSAGILEGDVIIQIGDRSTKADVFPEEILQQYKPGDKIVFKVSRKNQTLNLALIPTELK